jgi:Ca2+-binding RTX toxin-like protein
VIPAGVADGLAGAGRDDSTFGAAGGDTLSGVVCDILVGGADGDRRTGGAGCDLFAFEGNSASGADTVLEFGAGDALFISGGLVRADVGVEVVGGDVFVSWAADEVKLQGADASEPQILDRDFRARPCRRRRRRRRLAACPTRGVPP